jgi:hypothetical protein
MPNAGATCPVGAVCLSCRSTTKLRIRLASSPGGEICWTACEKCAIGWVPLSLKLDALAWLVAEHRQHLGLPPLPDRHAPPAPLPMALPTVLSDRYGAARLLDQYFNAARDDGSGPLYTGAMFDRLDGGGDRPDARDVIVAEDLVAVSMLSVQVPPRAALAILQVERDHLRHLLADIPADVDLVDADDPVIGKRSTAHLLWEVLVGLPGVGPVMAGKILARKRPRLIPVVDSVVLRTLGHPGASYWRDLRHHLRADDRRLQMFLAEVLRDVRLDGQVSVIRAFEVLVWLTGKTHVAHREPAL